MKKGIRLNSLIINEKIVHHNLKCVLLVNGNVTLKTLLWSSLPYVTMETDLGQDCQESVLSQEGALTCQTDNGQIHGQVVHY